MKGDSGIFVKLNYKNIGELQSFIYDRANSIKRNNDRYVMCAGKYDKSGWTIVFKAKSINEAQELVNINSKRTNKIIDSMMINSKRISITS